MQSGLLPTMSIHCHFDNFRVAGALADPSATERSAPKVQSSGHHVLVSLQPCFYTSGGKPSPIQTSGDTMGSKNHDHLGLNVCRIRYNVIE